MIKSLRNLLKKESFPLGFRVISLLFFILLMFTLYFGSITSLTIDLTSKLSLLIVWTLWWPFLYVSLLFFSRAWCGFLCPLSLANEIGNTIHNGKSVNVLKWSFVAYIIFFFVVFIEQTSGLFLSANTTLIFFSAFFITAFVFGLLFSRWSFCRLICPIGTLLGVFSRLSFIGLRTQKEKCIICKTKDCLVGGKALRCPMSNNVPNTQSNKNCLLCVNCIKNCPYDSPDIKLLSPGKEIIDGVNFSISESLFIIGLIGLTFILNSNGVRLFRKIPEFLDLSLNGSLLRLADFVLAIGLIIIAFIILSYITSELLKINFGDGLKKFGYVYLPLTFSIMFLTIVFGFLAPYVKLNDLIIALSKYFLLTIGTLWSIYFSYKIIYQKHHHGVFLGTASQIIAILFMVQ